jgi:hypothetical protein
MGPPQTVIVEVSVHSCLVALRCCLARRLVRLRPPCPPTSALSAYVRLVRLVRLVRQVRLRISALDLPLVLPLTLPLSLPLVLPTSGSTSGMPGWNPGSPNWSACSWIQLMIAFSCDALNVLP